MNDSVPAARPGVTNEPGVMRQAVDAEGVQAIARFVNVWRVALGVLASVLVLGGFVTTSVGLATVGRFDGTVLGQDPAFDDGVATAVVGGAAIALGILAGMCWLTIGALLWRRRG